MLDQLGLSPVSARIFDVASKIPGQSPHLLRQSLGLDVDDFSAGLSELINLGLASDNIAAVTTVSVERAIDMILSRHEQDFYSEKLALQNYRAIAQLLKSSQVPADTAQVEIVIGEPALRSRLQELCAETRNEVATIAPGSKRTREQLEANRSVNSAMFKQGIQSRTLYLSSVRNDRDTFEYLVWMNKMGAHVRLAAKLPIRMIIIDRKTAILPLDSTDGMNGLIIHRHPVTVLALQELFETTWESATRFGVIPGDDGIALSDETKIALELIATGKTDRQVATKMGLSERTVTRIVKSLMTKLGVSTRVEVIYRAAKMGWI